MEENIDEDIVAIDFKALFRVIWKEKWIIVCLSILFMLGGAWYAFTAREEFVSEGKIMPEISGAGGNSSLGGLANLVGIGGFELGLRNNTDAIRPDLYPDVLKSTSFFLNLFEQKFIDKNGDSLKFDTFYHEAVEDSEEIEEKLLSTFKGKPRGVILVNRLLENRIKDLKERISGTIDKKVGVISISVKMPDPVIAAQIAHYGMNYLTEYVTDYRTEQARQEVDFLGRKVAAAKGEFYKDQSRKASYADEFSAPTIRLQAADVQRERLESEYKLSASLYNELLKKLEEAKIKLQQETPVFQVLEPPVVPNLKREPQRIIIIIISAFTGVMLGICFVIGIKKNYKKILVKRK